MLRWAPPDSVSPGDANRWVGCASRISNKGVISEFRCSDRLAFFRSWLIQRLSVSIVGFFKKIFFKRSVS